MEVSLVRSGEYSTTSERWNVQPRDRAVAHNHPPSSHPAVHPVHRRAARNSEVRESITAAAEVDISAAQTLTRLNLDNSEGLILHRDIYNERQRTVNRRIGGLTRVEYLLRELEQDDYFVKYQQDENGRISHLFFTFVPAVAVYRENYDVVQLDCTYRTNRYGMPLLNMIGVSAMNTTTHIAQAIIRHEEQSDYEWVLRHLLAMMNQYRIPLPQVFFSDAELALINALEALFPAVPHLLCLWHVIKNVETHARTNTFKQVRDDETSNSRAVKWKDSESHRNFCDSFLRIIRSTTEEEYEFRRIEMHMLSTAEATYIDDVWLSLWKRRLVRCWTNGVVHFGMQATSRVEGYHATMKKWLVASRDDLLPIHTRLRHWWTQSINKYWASKAVEETRVLNRLRLQLYDAVVKVIASYALKQTDDIRLSTELLVQPGSGSYCQTRGVPCAHQIHVAVISGRCLLPTQCHTHWWINRSKAPVAPPAWVLVPETIADRRSQRRVDRRRQRQRGRGRWGTCQTPSLFDLSQQNVPPQ